MNRSLLTLIPALTLLVIFRTAAQSPRETLSLDHGWTFAFGHPSDPEKDFGHHTAYFSDLAKTGNGDGPADPAYDDRAWRKLDVPHDWAVEQPFSEKASASHGFKASGKGFTDRSIGWYRKKISIPASDLGRVISVRFDGVYRNATVWCNGFLLGTEASGYLPAQYDLSAYLNYGGENVLTVRVDASLEEGWYYEGAGIYRHVWLEKHAGLHLVPDGVAITTDQISEQKATVHVDLEVRNLTATPGPIEIRQLILDPNGKTVVKSMTETTAPGFFQTGITNMEFEVNRPKLWQPDYPMRYQLQTELLQNGQLIDRISTYFGIRTIRFDAKEGFFLNGRPLKLKGTNNHQDQSGIGVALPDAIQDFRIERLKEMGANAYRCSHHPPTSELLEACDRLGMLVIDETRLMGTNEMHLDAVRRMIRRDRNHPSIICWSLGNEEWKIEGNILGERIAQTMQTFARSLDPSRPTTVGLSSGFKSGISSVAEIIGYNYMANGDIDAHYKAFPDQPSIGTEEGSTFATRGIYQTDATQQYQSAYDRKPRPHFYSIEEGWNFYNSRPYLSGMFIWTGFDYRGEPTPYGWPSVTSYFGMMDLCGFAKDNFWYLKSWWQQEPVLHLLPHWNNPAETGKTVAVWAYSNCQEVELKLNGKSLGRKKMPRDGHLQWEVIYEKGKLEAIGYNEAKQVITAVRATSGATQKLQLEPHKKVCSGDTDAVVITVSARDAENREVPTADNLIHFEVQGGKIIGVGNGDPTSHEKERFLDELSFVTLEPLEEKTLPVSLLPTEAPLLNDQDWQPAFRQRDYKNPAPAYAYRTFFEYSTQDAENKLTFFYQPLGPESVVFLNGVRLKADAGDKNQFLLPEKALKKGTNNLLIVATPIVKKNDWDVANEKAGLLQQRQLAGQWQRRLFNGLAQLIVQPDSTKTPVQIRATAPGCEAAVLELKKEF